MQLSDIDEVIQLWDSIKELRFSREFDNKARVTQFLMRNENLSSIARENDKLIGALLCGHDGRRGFIYHTGVDEAFRHQGVASGMLKRSLAALKRESIDTCFLFTNDFNKEAREFWVYQGFEYAPHVMYHSRSI